MFGSVGITEIIIIGGVALMILGPERFPEFAKIAMRSVRDIRKYVSDAQKEISKELDPLKKELDDMSNVNAEGYIESILDEEYDDDAPLNPEPEFSSEELQAGMDNIDEENSEDESEDDTPSDETSEESEEVIQDSAVEYNLYGTETEGADPYGLDEDSAEEFNLGGGLEGVGEETETESPERLDG